MEAASVLLKSVQSSYDLKGVSSDARFYVLAEIVEFLVRCRTAQPQAYALGAEFRRIHESEIADLLATSPEEYASKKAAGRAALLEIARRRGTERFLDA